MIGVSTDILLYNVYFFQCAGVETYLPPVLKGEDTEKCRMFADSAHYLTNVPYPTQMSSSVPLVSHFFHKSNGAFNDIDLSERLSSAIRLHQDIV